MESENEPMMVVISGFRRRRGVPVSEIIVPDGMLLRLEGELWSAWRQEAAKMERPA